MRLMMSFLIFSLIGCAGGPNRPNTIVWGINGASEINRKNECPPNSRCGYYINSDYDDNGIRKPEAVAKIKPISNMKELNGAICFFPVKDPAQDQFKDEGIKGIKVWLQDIRDYAKEHCK